MRAVRVLLANVLVYAVVILDYQLGKNYGERFFDFSGFSHHGQNGDNLAGTNFDTTPTSRGAYFSNSTANYIKLPPNGFDAREFNYPYRFSLAVWLFPISNNYQSIVSHNTTTNSFEIFIKNSTYLCFRSRHSFGCDDINRYRWYFVLLRVGCSDKLEFYINEELKYRTETIRFNGTQVSDYIGYPNNSFKGYIWSFTLYDECISNSDLYEDRDSDSDPVNCYIETCSSNCESQIKIDSSFYCLPTNFTNPSQNSYNLNGTLCGNLCTGTCSNCNCLSKSFVIEKGVAKGCLCAIDVYEAKDASGVFGCSCTGATYNSTLMTCMPTSCYDECVSCPTSHYICDICKAANSEPHKFKGCTCMHGYYNSTSLVTGNCNKCINECSSCDNNQCFDCVDSNASLNILKNGCICDEGYYNLSNLSSGGYCIQCLPECKTYSK